MNRIDFTTTAVRPQVRDQGTVSQSVVAAAGFVALSKRQMDIGIYRPSKFFIHIIAVLGCVDKEPGIAARRL